jgi:hypothetical protein
MQHLIRLPSIAKEKNEMSLEMRQLWLHSMKPQKTELVDAAHQCAGVTTESLRSENLNAFWDGQNPPSS